MKAKTQQETAPFKRYHTPQGKPAFRSAARITQSSVSACALPQSKRLLWQRSCPRSGLRIARPSATFANHEAVTAQTVTEDRPIRKKGLSAFLECVQIIWMQGYFSSRLRSRLNSASSALRGSRPSKRIECTASQMGSSTPYCVPSVRSARTV